MFLDSRKFYVCLLSRSKMSSFSIIIESCVDLAFEGILLFEAIRSLRPRQPEQISQSKYRRQRVLYATVAIVQKWEWLNTNRLCLYEVNTILPEASQSGLKSLKTKCSLVLFVVPFVSLKGSAFFSYGFFFRSNDAVGNSQTGGIVKISRAYVLSAYGFSRDIFTRDGTYSIDVRRNILEARTCASSQILNIHGNWISQVISKSQTHKYLSHKHG